MRVTMNTLGPRSVNAPSGAELVTTAPTVARLRSATAHTVADITRWRPVLLYFARSSVSSQPAPSHRHANVSKM